MTAAEPRTPIVLPLVALLLLTLAAAGSSLGNGFAYDDVPMVLENARVHAGSPWWSYLGQGYWPSGNGLAYRPATVWLFSVQWSLGGGAPGVFHLVSLMLYFGTTVTLFLVAGRLMPLWAAWLAAALFTVHPVHVEAVANIVGQAELQAGLATLLALLLYLKARQEGNMTPARRLSLAGLALWAALAKEQGLLVPFIFVLAEASVVPRHERLGVRLRRLAPLWAILAPVIGIVLLLRHAALGRLAGGMQAIALSGASTGERMLTMLGVVPQWARLLLWPSHLQADYSPPALSRATAFGVPQALGVLLIVIVAAVIWRTWSRRPAIAFGGCFMILTLLPVSNLVVTTGIVLAERTLFLPSMGLVLGLAGAATVLVRAPAFVRFPAATAVLILLGAGAWRSARRQPVWYDNDRLFRQTLTDAPNNYRAYWLWSRHLRAEGRVDEAVDALLRSTELYANDPVVLEDLGQIQRRQGHCSRAVEPLERALAIDSTRVIARARLVQCLIQVGDLAGARQVAEAGLAQGDSGFAAPIARIDSLLTERDSAP
jgi:hypothetical protein